MDNNTFDVIMPVIYRDYAFLKKTVKYVKKNLLPAHIFIITDERFKRFLPAQILNDSQCIFIDENKLLDGMTFLSIKKMFKELGRNEIRTGWYYQQFLKMAFALSDYCDKDYYLSWDSDTIPLRNISFFDESGIPFFTMKTEHHEPYFETLGRLLDISKFNSRSYISENMMFKKSIMIDMINRIQSNHNLKGKTWYEKIVYALVPESVSLMGFSEFETYGNFCFNYYPDSYIERTLSSFRAGGLIQGRFISDKLLEQLSFDQDIASFEIYDRPPFPWGKLSYWYARWQRKKELIIRCFINHKK